MARRFPKYLLNGSTHPWFMAKGPWRQADDVTFIFKYQRALEQGNTFSDSVGKRMTGLIHKYGLIICGGPDTGPWTPPEKATATGEAA